MKSFWRTRLTAGAVATACAAALAAAGLAQRSSVLHAAQPAAADTLHKPTRAAHFATGNRVRRDAPSVQRAIEGATRRTRAARGRSTLTRGSHDLMLERSATDVVSRGVRSPINLGFPGREHLAFVGGWTSQPRPSDLP